MNNLSLEVAISRGAQREPMENILKLWPHINVEHYD